MSAFNRRPVFLAVRALRDGKGFTLDEVRLLDAAIDEALGAVTSPAPIAPQSGRQVGPKGIAVSVPGAAADLGCFFDTMRAGRVLGPMLSEQEVSGCKAIIEACAGWPAAWIAYAMATAYHETAGTMQPIKEYGGPAYFRRMYDPQGARPHVAKRLGNNVPGDGALFAGRGYVQLTGRVNYARAQERLGAPFIGNPDLAMKPEHAAAIMARGMTEGWFTGKSLKTYLPRASKATHAQFKEARRIINGVDKAAEIATYALEFQRALLA